MVRTQQDAALHRLALRRSHNFLYVTPPTTSTSRPLPSSFAFLSPAVLQICRHAVISVYKSFYILCFALVVTLSFLPRWVLSFWLPLLQPLKAFFLRKLHGMLIVVLLVSLIGLLGFLFGINSANVQVVNEEEHFSQAFASNRSETVIELINYRKEGEGSDYMADIAESDEEIADERSP